MPLKKIDNMTSKYLINELFLDNFRIKNDSMKFLASHDVQRHFASHLRTRRRAQRFSRDRLIARSTVPAPTIKRLELTGEMSFRQTCLLWETLDELSRLDELCSEAPMPTTIEEVLANATPRR